MAKRVSDVAEVVLQVEALAYEPQRRDRAAARCGAMLTCRCLALASRRHCTSLVSPRCAVGSHVHREAAQSKSVRKPAAAAAASADGTDAAVAGDGASGDAPMAAADDDDADADGDFRVDGWSDGVGEDSDDDAAANNDDDDDEGAEESKEPGPSVVWPLRSLRRAWRRVSVVSPLTAVGESCCCSSCCGCGARARAVGGGGGVYCGRDVCCVHLALPAR
jgi:hypothetical protein